jgi:flagella basal body P-ring formation protein FlgA
MWRIVVLSLLPQAALADSLIATRIIRAQTMIAPEDVTLVEAVIPGALTSADAAIGQEARVAIYAGRPVRALDLGQPTVIERNQTVALGFLSGGLQIRAVGRALGRGSVGDVIRVMNVASRTTVSGRIAPDGVVLVGPNP